MFGWRSLVELFDIFMTNFNPFFSALVIPINELLPDWAKWLLAVLLPFTGFTSFLDISLLQFALLSGAGIICALTLIKWIIGIVT